MLDVDLADFIFRLTDEDVELIGEDAFGTCPEFIIRKEIS